MTKTELATIAAEAMNTLNDIVTMHREQLTTKQINNVENLVALLSPEMRDRWYNNDQINF